jgi:peptide/nickel transport system substrate-binding protein
MAAMSDWKNAPARSKSLAISRREFTARAVALGAAAAFAPTIVGGAGALADTPKRGGLLRLAMVGGSQADSLDPRSYVDTVMICVGRGLFNGLVELSVDGKAAPELASNWDTRSSAAEWVFNLRKGVRFSNGQEFTADDAIYSLNLHRGETKSNAANVMKPVADIKKLDKYQIAVTLAAPDADFPYVLTDPHLLMVPADFKDWSKPVGTGAFVLEKFEPGARIALKKANGDFWKDGRGHVEAADITIIIDGAERIDALISGQADIINRLAPKALALLAKAPKTEIVRASGGWHPVLAMATDRAPYDNPDVRLAMKYAVDREQLLKALFGGYGALGNDHPIPPSDPYFNKEIPQRKRDPDKAAFYLRRSGLDPSIVLQVSEAAFAGGVDMGALVQASAGKAGFKMEIKKEPAEGYWDNVWLKGAFVESYWPGRPAATQMLSIAYGAEAPRNETHWKNEKFEKLLADAKEETDEARRKSYIWEMQALLSDQGGAIIPLFRDWIDAHRTGVGGHTPHSEFEMDNGYILEKAFLKT